MVFDMRQRSARSSATFSETCVFMVMDNHAPSSPASEEKLLVERARTDPEAFGKLYDLYYPRIAGYILRRVGHTQDAQDITANTFLKVIKTLPRFQWRDAPFSAWVYRIATNETDSYFRRRRFRILPFDFLPEKNMAKLIDPSGSLEQQMIADEQQLEDQDTYQTIIKLMQALPVKYQTVLALRYFEKKKLAEISEITGKNLGTVKSLLSRATRKLKTEYEASHDVTDNKKVQPFECLGVLPDVRRDQP